MLELFQEQKQKKISSSEINTVRQREVNVIMIDVSNIVW